LAQKSVNCGELTPALLAVPGCGPLPAAKIIGETPPSIRFKSRRATLATMGSHR
jgi:hypothetical protein